MMFGSLCCEQWLKSFATLENINIASLASHACACWVWQATFEGQHLLDYCWGWGRVGGAGPDHSCCTFREAGPSTFLSTCCVFFSSFVEYLLSTLWVFFEHFFIFLYFPSVFFLF